MSLETRKSNPNKPPRLVVYGRSGTGKSTLGARSERPIFISAEGGADQLVDARGEPINEIPGCTSWDACRINIGKLTTENHDFKTLVLDSADWLEGLCHKKIIGASGKDIIRVNGGYGAGYRESEKLHRELIDDLSTLRDKRDMNIIVIAHTAPKDAKDPELDPYDCYQMKCHTAVSELWKEWVDAMIFVRFRTFLKKEGENTTAFNDDDKRVAYTLDKGSCHAKNRYGLPAEMDFDLNFWDTFMGYVRKKPKSENIDEARSDIELLLQKVPDDVKENAIKFLTNAGDDLSKIISTRDRLKELAK